MRLAAVAVSYFVAGRLSLHFAAPPGMVSPLWPPAAIAVCACLAWGAGMLPAIWCAAALLNWTMGMNLPAAAMIATGNAAEAGIALWLARRWLAGDVPGSYADRAFRCVAAAGLASTAAATTGMAALALQWRSAPGEQMMQWLTWWIGDTTGIIVVAPLLLAYRCRPRIARRPAEMLEVTAFATFFPAVTYITFTQPFGILPLSYLPLPFVLWAAFRFSLTTLAWTTAIICLIAVWSTVHGYSVFAVRDLNTSLLMAMTYVGIVGTTGLAIASLLRQQRRAEDALLRERDELELRVRQKTEDLQRDVDERRRIELQLAEAQRMALLGSWTWDIASGQVSWSQALYDIYRLDPIRFRPTPQNCLSLIHPEDRARLTAAVEQARRHGQSFRLEHRIVLPSGEVRFATACGQLVRQGERMQIIGTIQDITETKLAEHSLREAEERYRMVVELSPDAILVQRDGNFVFANRAACELFGAADAQQLTGASILRFIHPDFHEIMHERMHRLQRGEALSAVEEKVVRLDGAVVDVELNAAPFTHEGQPASLMILRDITERRKTLEQMAQLAHFDSLTGLPNRMLFHQRLEHALVVAERPGRSLEILFLDLDRFKNINDTLGHAVGDLVLQETAHRLQSILRESDTVARLGGDEFVVLVENIDEPYRGGVIAEKILAAFAPPFLQEREPLAISTSIGIATYPKDGTDAKTLLKNADIAMYRAKEMGRNNYRYYSPEMNLHSAERLTLEYALGRAVEQGQLALHYQPKVDVLSGRIAGMEALLRWRHPGLGLLEPQRFIGIAEETGLIRSIGYWAIRQACAQNKRWQESGAARLRVAVNISLRQLADESLLDNLRLILEETGLEARYLELELTESALMSNPGKTMQVLGGLRAMGISVAIDDFGAGYSSLAYLRQFPIRAVKIDRSFVQGLPGNRGDSAITKAIINLAHSLECTVIAEGAETQEQYEFLRAHACDGAQGYYFGKPMPAESFGNLLMTPSGMPLH